MLEVYVLSHCNDVNLAQAHKLLGVELYTSHHGLQTTRIKILKFPQSNSLFAHDKLAYTSNMAVLLVSRIQQHHVHWNVTATV